MLTVIATTCVAAVCGGTKSSVCLHHSYNKGNSNPQVPPWVPRGKARLQLSWPGRKSQSS